jgi:hypothetical protein
MYEQISLTLPYTHTHKLIEQESTTNKEVDLM